MIRIKWEKEKKIDTEVKDNKIGNFDNENNSVNLKKVENSTVIIESKIKEIDKVNDLSDLEIKQYKIVSNLQTCNDCLNSMSSEIMRLINLQNKCKERTIETWNNRKFGYVYDYTRDWNNLEQKKLIIAKEGLNFDFCDIHKNLQDTLIELHIRIKNFKEK